MSPAPAVPAIIQSRGRPRPYLTAAIKTAAYQTAMCAGHQRNSPDRKSLHVASRRVCASGGKP